MQGLFPTRTRQTLHLLGGLLWFLIFSISSPLWAQAREVRVGVYQNEPKIFMNSSAQPTGILGDLLTKIAAEEGWKLVAVRCEWQACLDALVAGQLDLMPDVAYNAHRATIFDFHKVPSLLSWSQIYKRTGVTINSALDLKGKRIAVLGGSVQQTYLEGLLMGFRIDAELVPVKSLQTGFEMASSGSVDAAAANRFFGDMQAPRFKLESTPILFQPAELFFATAKGRNADLLLSIDRHLQRWGSQPDSVYFAILKRWMESPQKYYVPTYVWWMLSLMGVLLITAFTASLLLRREVARKTGSLKASEDRLATILNSVDAFIYIKDTELRYQYANRKVCELFGTTADGVVGKTDAAFFDPATVASLQANDQRVIAKGERVEEEETNRSTDGSATHTYLSVKLPLRHDDGKIYALVGISTDISKQKQAEEAIHRLAFYDPLTELPNRRLMLERMQLSLHAHGRDKQCGALLFIDIDNFKDVNDTQGHQVGDQLLRQAAKRLSGCMRAEDTLARLGGDEFVVLLENLSPLMDDAVQQARTVAEKIVHQLAVPYVLDGQTQPSSVSIGVAMISGKGNSQDDLLKQADLAMYRAKAEGRNTVRFFDPQMQARVNERTALETELRQGLEEGQFVLHYQPQMADDGTQLGMEALVRWQHPQRGLIAPGLFIPVAESSGLILPMGQWILTAACRQLMVWSAQEDKSHWVVAVNVSARQFRHTDFVQNVRDVLQTTGANPQRLELELTESQLVEDVDSVIAKMTALKALGVRLSLDDFGTGYSSLSMLKRLPLDQLKIDQSFVRDLLTDPQDASIVRAIITMGESLELEVIAEGVETNEQRDALRALGCRHYQGYLFGRPAPV